MGRKRMKTHHFKSDFVESKLNWNGMVTLRAYKFGEEVLIEVPFNTLYGLISSTKKAVNEMQGYVDNIKENLKT